MGLSQQEIEKQSWAAFNQWKRDWLNNTKHNKDFIKTSLYGDLRGIGRGKSLIICANGPSLAKHFKILKDNRSLFHISCVDKAFKPLMDNGIKPDYVCLADANVSYEKHCKGLDTENVALLSNVCGQKDWVANWKGPIFFYINRDSIKSEEYFMAISGYGELIPAASNVSNALLMLAYFVLQYDWNFLTGYDYSWKLGTYYSDESENNKKECWMASQLYSDIKGELMRTSSNLVFSARWISDFFKSLQIKNYINCSDQGLLYDAPKQKMEQCIKSMKRYYSTQAIL